MVSVTGPLVCYVPGFVAALQSDGYRPASVQCHVELLAHVSRWLEAGDLDAIDLTSTRADEFLRGRKTEGYARLVTSKGVAPLLRYLRASGAIPEPFATNQSANDELLMHFSEYLVEERGLGRTTARDYVRVARRFVDDYSAARLGDLTIEQVLRFVTGQCRRHVPNPVITGLRAFLRFCYLRGVTVNNFASVIPAVANVGRSSLAMRVAPSEVLRLLESCDRTTASGSRNFAILSVLSRLGLRAREAAVMQLSDID
jgi:integrase/recombinase XerD